MGIVVTIEHVRAARLDGRDGRGVNCVPGIRLWADRHGIELRTFLREGLPIEAVEQIDDAFAQRVAAIAREEATDA